MCRNVRKRTFGRIRTYAPSEDSDQTAHSRSLIRIFTERILDSQGCKVSSCGQRRFDQTVRICFESSLGAHISTYVFSCCGANGMRRKE